MKTRSFYPGLLAVFLIGSVLSQNAEELPVHVETDNQFPPDHSELDLHNEGSETTSGEPTHLTSESTVVDVAASTLNNDEQIINEDNESSDSMPESSVDGAATTLTNEDEKVTYNKDDETTAAEPTHLTSGSTVKDVAAPILVAHDNEVNYEGSETTVVEHTEPTLESTIADTIASTLATKVDQVTNNEYSKTTAAEPSQTMSESTLADVAATLITKDEQETTSEGLETTAVEPTQLTSGSTIADVPAPALSNDDDKVSNNHSGETTAADTTQLASGSTIADVVVPTLSAEVEPKTIYEGSDTTVVEPYELTSGSTTADVAAPTLTVKDEQEATNEDSETTVVEPSKSPSGSTIADVVVPSLTTKDDQVTNTEVSESTNVKLSVAGELPCPKPCVCITEEDLSYIVDCSGNGLTELPTAIDPKTTTLKLHNNKLTVIPKAISELKNLKNLIANDNLITDLESESVGELPELVSLTLANNRLLEYPKDLENSLTLNKLEELDLAGNEFKTTPEIFLNYKALRTITLPEVSPELVSSLCTSLKETLVNVCTKSCNEHLIKCTDVLAHIKDGSLATLPGMIPLIPENVKDTEKSDDIFGLFNAVLDTQGTSETKVTSNTLLEPPSLRTKETPDMPVPDILSNSRRKESSEIPIKQQLPETSSESKGNVPINDFSLRTIVHNAPAGEEKVALQNIVIDTPKESAYNETEVKVGAKTTETKGGGGVDKSVIAVIVAGMVIVIAVITVKKNWGSIRKRFSSTPTPNDRSDRNANGITPEEVPLQDKSPV